MGALVIIVVSSCVNLYSIRSLELKRIAIKQFPVESAADKAEKDFTIGENLREYQKNVFRVCKVKIFATLIFVFLGLEHINFHDHENETEWEKK